MPNTSSKNSASGSQKAQTGAAGNIIGIYQRFAQVWAADRSKQLIEKLWLDKFLALVAPGSSVLDLGCGCADPMARYILSRGYRVTGIDTSDGLIALCRESFPASSWLVADMRQLHLNKRFDGLLAWDSFFHLTAEDQRAMFSIFADHAQPEAALMFTSGPQAGEAIGDYRGEALYHASLGPAEYRELLAANGFTVVDHIADDPTCGYHTVWLARRAACVLKLDVLYRDSARR